MHSIDIHPAVPAARPVRALLQAAHVAQAACSALFAPHAVKPCADVALHTLAARSIVAVTQPLGKRIECLEGCLWVTQDNDVRDLVLDAGQAVTIDREQRVLIQALEPARLRISAAGA